MRKVISSVVFLLIVGVGPLQAQIPCLPHTLTYGDYDQRGDVAYADLAAFASCMYGPDVSPPPPTTNPCLQAFDSNGDGDVDAADLSRFMRQFTGPCEGLGDCPPGTHLEHMSGQVGTIFDPGESEMGEPGPPPPLPDAGEFRCAPDESCSGVDCSAHGRCAVESGKAVCVCAPGYGGEFCDECTTGHERDRNEDCVLGDECRERFCSGQGNCMLRGDELVCDCDTGASGLHCEDGGGGTELRGPTYIIITGTAQSIEPGEIRQMCATLKGGGTIDQQTIWTMTGPGAMTGSGLCRFYVAPPVGTLTDSQLVEIKVCSQSFPSDCAIRYLTIDPAGEIQSTGQAHVVLKPFDDVIKRYMRQRCVGGAILGVSVFGKPVYVRGYGNLSGAPTNDPAYLEACGDTFNVSGLVPGHPLPAPSEVQPNSPFRIGSISKSVTAAIVRKHVKEEILVTDTDANVEALGICEGILPTSLHEVACIGLQPPISLLSVSGFPPDCDDEEPCPYGGTCMPTNMVTNQGFCSNCPFGFAGLDCSRNTNFCDPAEADDRWEDVTLGHLMGHRSGLPRSVPDLFGIILPGLFQLRGLMTENDWADQENNLTSETGWPNGSFAMEFPNYDAAADDIGSEAYFVPRPSVEEAVLSRMGSCLLSNPGSSTLYSNTGFSFLGVIVEFITGRHFSGKLGKPQLHSGSLLEEFSDDQLGLPVPGQGTAGGIFYSQSVFDLRNIKEPVWRAWSTVTNTYYKPVDDEKRPWCEWDGNSSLCRFNDWISGILRFDWRFADKQVIIPYHGAAFSGAGTAGSLSTEAEVFLRFMAKYWVGGDGSNPRYGETRCPGGDCVWTLSIGHNGALDGTYAEAKQLGGPVKPSNQFSCTTDDNCPVYTACANTDQEEMGVKEFCRGGKCWRYNQYTIPPLDPVTGKITDDYANTECHRCRLPVGVDIFIALNQRSDKKCREAEGLEEDDPDYYTCGDAYGMLTGMVLHAACKVPWPPNPFVLWPPVFHEGGSSMSPQFSGSP